MENKMITLYGNENFVMVHTNEDIEPEVSNFTDFTVIDVISEDNSVYLVNNVDRENKENWDGFSSNYEWFDDHRDDDTFYIETAAELKAFADMCNTTKDTDYPHFVDKRICLAADINLNGKEWKPIKKFGGVFEGSSFSIIGLTAPLFESTIDATISNLAIEANMKYASCPCVLAIEANNTSFMNIDLYGVFNIAEGVNTAGFVQKGVNLSFKYCRNYLDLVYDVDIKERFNLVYAGFVYDLSYLYSNNEIVNAFEYCINNSGENIELFSMCDCRNYYFSKLESLSDALIVFKHLEFPALFPIIFVANTLQYTVSGLCVSGRLVSNDNGQFIPRSKTITCNKIDGAKVPELVKCIDYKFIKTDFHYEKSAYEFKKQLECEV